MFVGSHLVGMSDSILSVFAAALGATIKLFLTASVGFVAARRPRGAPLLPPTAIRDASRLSAAVFIPCLITHSIGSSVSRELLAQSVCLLAGGLLTIAFGDLGMLAWGALAVPAAMRATSLWKVARVAGAFPNIVAFPLVVMGALCERADVGAPYDDVGACRNEGAALIFLNSFTWSAVFFTLGIARLEAIQRETAPRDDAADAAAPATAAPAARAPRCKACTTFLTEPLNVALAVGIAIGLTPRLQRALFATAERGALALTLRPLGGTVEMLASPVVCLVVSFTGASLAHVRLDRIGGARSPAAAALPERAEGAAGGDGGDEDKPAPRGAPDDDQGSDKLAVDVAVIAVDDELDCGGDEAKDGTACDDEAVATATPADDAAAESKPPTLRDVLKATREISPIIGGFLFVRLLLVPACIALVFVALPRRLAMPRMPLAQLLLLISSGMPSAQILVVLLNKLGMGATASELSFLFIFQYTTGLITTTALVSIALWVVYE